MKSYSIYRNIRSQAKIFGLPINLFALQMLGVIAGLLAIIFSFGWISVLLSLTVNGILYPLLLKLSSGSVNLILVCVFPRLLINHQNSNINYES